MSIDIFKQVMNFSASYCNDLLLNACDSKAKPKVVKESASTAFVDGQNTFGATVGNFCMNLAIQKAKETGVGWVVAHRKVFLNFIQNMTSTNIIIKLLLFYSKDQITMELLVGIL